MKKTIKFKKWTCQVELTKYMSNNRTAIVLKDIEDGQVVVKATANLLDFDLRPNHVLIKNYAENEGVLEALVTNKVIAPPYGYVESGFEKLYICKLLI